jgi:hypothetical protein
MTKSFWMVFFLAAAFSQPAAAQGGDTSQDCPKVFVCTADGCNAVVECSGFVKNSVLEIVSGQAAPLPSIDELDYEMIKLGFPQLTSRSISGQVSSDQPVYGSRGSMVTGGRLNGSILPNGNGGMVVGGLLDGSILPGAKGGMIIGGRYSGTIMPGAEGGMIIGGPLDGTIMPSSNGGMIVGGPLSGQIVPPRN